MCFSRGAPGVTLTACGRCLQWTAEEQRAAAEAARRQEEEAMQHAVHTGPLLLEGQPAGQPCAEDTGGFELMEPALAVNGRPVYRAANGKEFYFYLGSDSKWNVNDEADMRAGKAYGNVFSEAEEPDALTPDQVQGGWKVLDRAKRAYVEAPSVRVRQVRCSSGGWRGCASAGGRRVSH